MVRNTSLPIALQTKKHMSIVRRLCVTLLKKWMKPKTRTQRRFIMLIILLIVCYKLVQRQRRKMRIRNTIRRTIKSSLRHRIVFGISGNLLVYQMGVIKAIFEHYGVDIFREKCTFEGISGGSATSGYAIATVHGCGDMDFWFMHGSSVPTKAAINRRLGMFFTTSNVIYKLGQSYYDRILKWNNYTKPKWLRNNQWIMWITCADPVDPEFLCNVNYTGSGSADNVASIITASSYIPFVLSRWFYHKIGANKAIDGGIAQHVMGDETILRANNCEGRECKVLYINCDILFGNGDSKRVLSSGNVVYYLDICKWDKFTVKDYMIWPDMGSTNRLYQRGYDLAKKNMQHIDTVLKDFFDDTC